MDTESVLTLQKSSYLSDGNIAYIESLYDQYLNDPTSVPEAWQNYFKSFGQGSDTALSEVREQFKQMAKQKTVPVTGKGCTEAELVHQHKEAQIQQLINAYRSYGHHHAKLDPLEMVPRKDIPELHIGHYGFTQADLNTQFKTGNLVGPGQGTLSQIQDALNDTYSSSIGVEYMHISNAEETTWIQQRLESVRGKAKLNKAQKLNILEKLTEAEGLERYLGAKYVGQTRFSLEGGVSLVPLMDQLIQQSGGLGVKELIIGMGHRGRLNVLVNNLGKPLDVLFKEFKGKTENPDYSGDVKYHMGFSSNVQTPGGIIHLAMAFNPSHLEIINPVVEGSVRARQDHRVDLIRNEVIPVLMHGDAAFAGQGVVMETFAFSQARGFATGGTVHIVVNNQIGFTTSNPLDARSSLYCTDIAKMVQAPIFHVNGDDAEAVVFATQVALDYRMIFNKDVVIDLVCYRRLGHNEADEPSATQPLMYHKIKNHPRTRDIYLQQLLNEGIITESAAGASWEAYRVKLDNNEPIIKTIPKEETGQVFANWHPYKDQVWTTPVATKISMPELQTLGKRILSIPEGFAVQTQVAKEYENRAGMLSGEIPFNWGMAEALAYASLLTDGYPVRLSGQDSGRGTFAHRHAVLHDQNDGRVYIPLEHLRDNQAKFTVIDSILSEAGVLGFEYGYATTDPESLVIWEAQYGDFGNGAQVVFDQFITSGVQKWGRLCGLTVFLPHGHEGAGPEHSSARLERFLNACAQKNIQVCVPTTPAQMFHMLRRQMIRPYRKPLIVMTPKSLLRNKLSTSPLDAFTDGEFKVVIPEIEKLNPANIKRIILCSGKVYFDLLKERTERNQKDVAIIRIEQLYPFPRLALQQELAHYKNAKQVIWCQEEPKNQGSWFSIQHYITECKGKDQVLQYVGRPPMAAPASGYSSMHLSQQQVLVNEALTLSE